MMNPKQPDNILHVSVKSPQQLHYEGLAKAVTSINKKGKFDILVNHANFITIIKQYLIIHFENKKDLKIPIEQGVIKVSKNNVQVFLGVGIKS